jgi:hypothetical protein
MNIKEFAALKVGDKIDNPMNPGSTAEVVEATDSGIRIVWGRRHDNETRFFYSVNSTAWMHWTVHEPDLPAASHQSQYSS